MVCRGTVLAMLVAVTPALAQVAAPKTEPPAKPTFAQIGLFIYPAKEQTPDQQKKDEDACYAWAEANTGLTLVPGTVDAQAAGKSAAKDAAHRELIESGIADLDKRAGAGGYRTLGWEEERVAVLEQIEATPFFQAVRGGLVVGLYNQKEIWPLFGYEGESYSKGGYIDRGFDDIEWL